ncbi:MAG: HpsJ family protein [Oculatellaceae cyanobacterium Prado106]|jgi:hypothetical protein|nr:HpsJ family protein [Oculatellaceae cyanobacterium Prado106]
MRSTQASNLSVLVSRTLKTVGIVIILATLLDLVIAAMPYNFGDRQWQIGFTTQMVDRGIVPLVGIVLFITGFWVDSNLGNLPERKSLFTDPRFWAFALASLLGLMYVVLFPLHLMNIGWSNEQAIAQINQRAEQAQTELGNQLNTEISSQRQQINQLISATDEQLKQLEDGGQLSREQGQLIRDFKADPKKVDPFLQQREKETRDQLQTRIGTEKLQAEKTAQTEALKSGLRIGISSLLLAAGFIVVGWSGLRNLGQM